MKTLGVLGGMTSGSVVFYVLEKCIENKKYFKLQNMYFRRKKYPLRRKNKNLFLSDQHNKIYGNTNEVLYEAVWEEKPDLILIGGDMLIGKRGVSAKPAYF